MTAASDLFAAPRTEKPAKLATPVKALTLKNSNGAYRCQECGADAHFGFGQQPGEPLAGAWFCGAHKDLGW